MTSIFSERETKKFGADKSVLYIFHSTKWLEKEHHNPGEHLPKCCIWVLCSSKNHTAFALKDKPGMIYVSYYYKQIPQTDQNQPMDLSC